MKIPTLTDGPKVSWTAENAAKSTTTAVFNEATLTVKKMAAINALQSGTKQKCLVKNWINCWETLLTRTISSQVSV
jgi:hypothetical protein